MSDSPLLLAINAAEARLQLVLGRDDGPGGVQFAAAQEWHAPSQGAEILAPSLLAMLERLGAGSRDIGRVACVNGPGSFTGLRLALATAAGLARSAGALQGALPYLPLLAGEIRARMPAGLIPARTRLWIITHARRNSVHVQGFDLDGDQPAPVGQPLVLALDRVPGDPLAKLPTLAEHILSASGSDPVWLAGSGVFRNRTAIAAALPQAKLLPEDWNHPSPEGLLRAAVSVDFSREDILPLYIRASDAEEKLSHIAAKLGLDPDRARQELDRLTTDFAPEVE